MNITKIFSNFRSFISFIYSATKISEFNFLHYKNWKTPPKILSPLCILERVSRAMQMRKWCKTRICIKRNRLFSYSKFVHFKFSFLFKLKGKSIFLLMWFKKKKEIYIFHIKLFYFFKNESKMILKLKIICSITSSNNK